MLDRVKGELYSDAGMALRLLKAVLSLPHMDNVVHGRARRLQAHGLSKKGDIARARVALEQATAVLADDPAGALELLHVRLLQAYLNNLDGDDGALAEVRLVAKRFAAHGDASGTLHAQLMEAVLLFERKEFVWASKINRDALAIAQTLQDEQQEAIAFANLGHCAQQLGARAHAAGKVVKAQAHAEEALGYFARATPVYAQYGMDAERQRIIWAIAAITQQRGNLETARSQYLKVRAEFLQRSMFFSAALVALDLMQLLITLDRHDLVLPWYDEVAATFTRAGMPRHVLEALNRVQVVATERPIDKPLLARVRSEVQEHFAAAA